jgi:hypothetical protein
VEIQRVLPAVLFNDVIGFRAISSDMNTAKQSEDHRQTDNQHTEIKLSVDQGLYSIICMSIRKSPTQPILSLAAWTTGRARARK